MSPPGIDAGVQGALLKMQAMARYYFQKLEPTFEYKILSPLMSYLTLPGAGTMYSAAYRPSDLPASITFMGQFIDHD